MLDSLIFHNASQVEQLKMIRNVIRLYNIYVPQIVAVYVRCALHTFSPLNFTNEDSTATIQ